MGPGEEDNSSVVNYFSFLFVWAEWQQEVAMVKLSSHITELMFANL